MATLTITLPFVPNDPVYIIWDNKIQKGICTQVNMNVTKPGITLIQDNRARIQLAADTNRIIYKPIDQVFLTADAAAIWLEANVIPPTIL